MRRQAGVFAGKNAALVRDELLEQVGVLEIEGVHREVDLGFGARGTDFGDAVATAAAAFITVRVGLAWHKSYLISRCNVCRRSAGLYLRNWIFSVFSFLLRLVR